MAKSPDHARYLDTPEGQSGFSSIAPGFWRCAEKLRDEAVQQTAKQSWPAHQNVHSAICLYHASLDCFINEEITIGEMLRGSPSVAAGNKIQGMTLTGDKIDGFYTHFGLKEKLEPEIRRSDNTTFQSSKSPFTPLA